MDLLLVSPRTYNYHNLIIEACERLSISVKWIDERPYANSWFKTLSRFANPIARRICTSHYIKLFDSLRAQQFIPTHVLVVKGEALHPAFLQYIQHHSPNCKFSLYFWDSADNLPGHSLLKSFFDEIWSFDLHDCLLYNWKYRPLFAGNFSPTSPLADASSSPLDPEYLWSFVGVVHSDRLNILARLVQSNPVGSKFFLYLYMPSVFHLILFFFLSPFAFMRLRAFLHLCPLPAPLLISVYESSNYIVDIAHPSQAGLTMRTIESIFSGRCIATTNEYCCYDSLYDETRFFAINRDKPCVPVFNSERSFLPLSREIRERYTAESWLCEILGISRVKSLFVGPWRG